MGEFDDRTVVITGAASGIGAELARLFAEEGAEVFAADLADGAPVQVDVTDPASVQRLVETVVERTGRLDILCNNAGIGSTSDPVSCSVEEWDRVFAVNARGVFLCTKFALPHMLAAGRGVIVNTASVAGMIGLPARTAYCASKGAVIALTKQVAVEYAARGIRCNCICPGTVSSPWVDRLVADSDDPEETLRALVARQPLGRLATMVEIAQAALYLASDRAAFVTGEALVIDGGLTAA